eukprot:TRINITY_DN8395_c0_g1_i1.p1 TRINITY_DN8395_c0_g1~~TRINITY_DN8395_c0_g1_i1.p1  ORF type:complete len:170 (+),score=67.66 TRINITY_DN8395_c0_g1_i1:185-694(+)
MQIFIKSYGGKTVTLDCEPDNTIFELKQMFEEKEGTPPHLLRFLHSQSGKERVLEDTLTLQHYNIQKEEMIHFNTKIRSGRWLTIVNDVDEERRERIELMNPTVEWMRIEAARALDVQMEDVKEMKRVGDEEEWVVEKDEDVERLMDDDVVRVVLEKGEKEDDVVVLVE